MLLELLWVRILVCEIRDDGEDLPVPELEADTPGNLISETEGKLW